MPLVICLGGRVLHAAALQSYFNTNTILKLYRNNKAPVRGDSASDYTEANFGGYASVSLNAWGAPAMLGDFHAQISEIQRTFTCTAGPFDNVIYGYYVIDAAGNLQWAELAPTPFAMSAKDLSFTIQPRFTYTSEFGA